MNKSLSANLDPSSPHNHYHLALYFSMTLPCLFTYGPTTYRGSATALEMASYLRSLESIQYCCQWDPIAEWNMLLECTDKRRFSQEDMEMETKHENGRWEIRVSTIDTVYGVWIYYQEPSDETVRNQVQDTALKIHWGLV
jgi:hypothetical protein